jgi:hypothetical protein
MRLAHTSLAARAGTSKGAKRVERSFDSRVVWTLLMVGGACDHAPRAAPRPPALHPLAAPEADGPTAARLRLALSARRSRRPSTNSALLLGVHVPASHRVADYAYECRLTLSVFKLTGWCAPRVSEHARLTRHITVIVASGFFALRVPREPRSPAITRWRSEEAMKGVDGSVRLGWRSNVCGLVETCSWRCQPCENGHVAYTPYRSFTRRPPRCRR